MRKNLLNTTHVYRTGKDIIKLLNEKKNVSKQEGPLPSTDAEWKVCAIWENVLGYNGFSVKDNFFQIGGNSLKAVQLVTRICRHFGVNIPLADVFIHTTIEQQAAHILVQEKKLLPSFKETQFRPEPLPLSFNQERLWFIDQLEGSVQYHTPEVLRLRGSLDIGALVVAFRGIVNRHEVLRTVYRQQDGEPYQLIREKDQWQLCFVDGLPYQNDPAGLQHFTDELIHQPFDLSEDSMLRAHLITPLGQEEHLLVLVMHHIASDGWSEAVFVRELVSLYDAAIHNQEASPLPPLSIQYADYAIWQRQYLQGELLDKKVAYWKEKLSGVSPLQLPTDFPRPAVQSTKGAVSHFTIDKELKEKLQQLSQQQGTTLFMTLLAAFKVLLYRYSGQQDICVGTPTANRTVEEIEDLIGFFVNTLALRSEVRQELSFTELLQQVKTTTLQAYEHGEVPFEKVVEAVVRERDMSRSPLFQVMMVWQNTPPSQPLKLGEVEVIKEAHAHTTAKFDLTLSLKETQQGISGLVEYCTDLFSGQSISRLMAHFTQLLLSLVQTPGEGVGKIKMLSGQEEQQLLKGFNDTSTPYPFDKTVVELFEEQVAKTPNAVALVMDNQHLTYQQLNEKSNQLAHYLKEKGLAAESLVPICIERSVEMIIGVLAILKAGFTYVPIDPEYPQERIHYMLQDVKAVVLVSNKQGRGKLPAKNDLQIIEVDSEWPVIGQQPAKNLQKTVTLNSLVYIIYTSGSTGKPKGVKMPNNGMVNLLLWQQKQFQNKNRRVLQFASLNFDVSFQEIFSTLCFGSTLHLIQSDRRTDMAEILKDIHRYAITHLFIPYIVLKNFVEHIHAHNCRSLPLEEIITAGEQLKLTNDIYDWMQKSSIKIINQYGPTEAHVVSSYTIDSNSVLQQLPPIGKPIDNTRLYVLSNTHELMPIGVAGELYIGGVQVAQGYLNQPELTSNKFIPDPFSEKPGARLYKSGDLACWLPDGNIEYLGRIDDQVKIRGYRIELGEIESILQECPLVKQGVILAKENSSGHKQLIGYVIPEGEFNKEALLAYLEEKLPKYMVPSLWVEMENLPVTANGKINKKALPDPYTEDLSSSSYIAPRNPIETKLAGIWQEVLKVNKVSIHDNFFELGGHSLLTMRLIAAVRRRLELEMIVKDLFAHSTVATLAVHLQKQQRGLTLPVISLQSRPERISLSFNQDRLWFIDRLQGSVQYHLPMAFKLTGRLDKNALASALQTIVNRHQVLRTVIQQDENGKPYQHIKEKNHWQLNVVENKLYRHSSDSLQQYIEQLINEPFDLSSDDMLRAHLISLNEEEYVLIATMHHIASDGWSTSVFIKELAALYKAFEENGPIPLPPLELQYADYALWQRRYLQGELLEKKLAYWKEKLSGVSPLQLPTDLVRPAVQSSLGTVAEFHLDIKVSKALQQLSQQQGTTLFMTLLAAFKVLLYRYSGQEDICVGSVAADRQQPEVEQLIGFFINTLTLRSEVKGNLSFTDLLQQVKATILEAYEYGDVPFEKVVEATVKERDLSRNPLFDVMFVWQNTPPVAERFLGEVELTQYAFAYNKTKFDITFTITETDNGLHGIVEYCTDLYTLQTMNRMFGHYEELLVSIIKDPGQKVSTLPMLTSVERHQLLEEFNATTSPYPWDKTIVQLFEDQVRESPSAVAIVFEDEQLTYQQLNERANQLAGYLRSKGVGTERLLPICIERSIEMIVGILGILKAGAAYVPIDPEYPQERISYMLQDTGATLVLTSNGTSAMLPQVAGVEMIDINTAELTQEPTGNLQVSISPGNLAYVIYTSGSTGKPKGVPVEHQAYLNINTCYHKILQGEQTILTCNYVFDVSVLEIFSTLLGGGCLNIPQPTVIFDPATFAQFLYQRKISAAYIHPMYLNDVAIALEDYSECYLQKILIGVEPIRKEAVQWYLQNKISIINGYGPTETTICASFYLVDKNVSQYSPLPIGRPVANTQIYILDEVGQLCPVGVAGQLCIGGVQVARGYLNRPELTGEKFIQDPFRTGGRVYRTGDLGRWLPDGNIEYLGRMDDQVKIRGYRIELGEIESVIQESGFTKQVVVLAKQEANEPKQLVGYVVSEGNFDREGMIAYLKDKLPYYMIPSLWVEIEKLPLTINGKVDKKALSALNSGYHPSGHRFVAPQTETEVRLADIWKELLGIEQVGIHDNFFELGGHSLLVMRQSASIERNFLVSVPVRVLFQFTSISELGKYLEIQLRNYSAEQHTKGYQLFNI